MGELELELQELDDALAEASREQPCGCADTGALEDASLDLGGFGDLGALSDAEAELESAFQGTISAEEEAEFALLEEENAPTLDSLVAFAERYPGLTISFSFTK